MRYSEFKEILKEELGFILQERVGSKVLDRDKLDKALKRYVRNNFNFNDDYLDDRLGVEHEIGSRERINITVPPELKNLNWNKFFKRYGYYVANIDKGNNYATTMALFPYETDKVDQLETPLYHITPRNKLLKIKKRGLSPRKSTKLFDVDDPRIYFIRNTSEGMSEISVVRRQLSRYVSKNPPFENEMAILKIDPSKVEAEFYKDPEVSSWAVFTRDNIPPSAVTNWENYEYELDVLKKRKK